MCGFLVIASAFEEAPLPHSRDELDRLRDVLQNRGPDAGATELDPSEHVALMHRRLRVIDLEGSAQPMTDRSGRYSVVYNGELYNFRELRDELRRAGRDFETEGDTEVVLQAYAEWGEDAPARFNGIFAFAVFDRDQKTIFVARDQLGVKPVSFGVWDGRLYIASDTSAIVADRRVPRVVDVEALDLYLHHGYVPAPWSIWQGMQKLQAAHHITFRLDGSVPRGAEPRRFWDVPFGRTVALRREKSSLVDQIDDVLSNAVRRQTVSDVPLGAFLSGGIDSSLIVSYLAEISKEPVRTFSVGFNEKAYDEREFARDIANRFGTEHHEIILDARSVDFVDELAEAYDEPFCDQAALPTLLVSRLAREKVTVALSGDGGDETYAGYRRYLRQAQTLGFDKVPLGLRQSLLGPLASLRPSLKRRGALEQATRDLVDRYDAVMASLPPTYRSRIYNDACRARFDSANDGAPSWWREIAEQYDRDVHVLDRLQALDLASYLPEQLMTKTDRASMRVSLEVRVPFLDLEAVEFAAGIPAELRNDGRRTKALLRDLLARRAPGLSAERKKQGFQVPIKKWFADFPRRRLEELVVPEAVEPWFDRRALAELLLDHPRGVEFAWPFAAFAAWQKRFAAS